MPNRSSNVINRIAKTKKKVVQWINVRHFPCPLLNVQNLEEKDQYFKKLKLHVPLLLHDSSIIPFLYPCGTFLWSI